MLRFRMGFKHNYLATHMAVVMYQRCYCYDEGLGWTWDGLRMGLGCHYLPSLIVDMLKGCMLKRM